MLIDDIIHAYENYRVDVVKEKKHPKHLKVVILMHPMVYWKFYEEINQYIYTNFDSYLNGEVRIISLHGNDTPIIIDETLPKNINFIMIAEEDYKKQHYENEIRKLFQEKGME